MVRKTILSFFKPKNDDSQLNRNNNNTQSTPSNVINATDLTSPDPPRKIQRVESTKEDIRFIRDPGLRRQVWEHPIADRDEIRRKYLNLGPYQPSQEEYPPTFDGKQDRYFQKKWFSMYPWLEYSIEKDRAYCFYCYLFETNPPTRPAYTVEGFKGWRRIGGPNCPFLKHVGDVSSTHMRVVCSSEDLMNPLQHIRRVFDAQSKEEIEKNRLRLKTSFICARWLAFQACSFRGHDESLDSLNPGNFIELIKHTTNHNEKVDAVVLKNAPRNATYTSSMIQKELLNILDDNVRRKIRKEIGEACYYILVDEAQDISMKEQMAIILRFVDDAGDVRERFFGIVSVENTAALTLKKSIVEVLSEYDLHVHKMRGQGYDGASNMRGAWNGLQALFLNECPYAYYVHCFAHQLQLALVSASKDVQDIWLFFSKLNVVMNIVGASPKRHSQLQLKQAVDIANKVALGELPTGTGINQKKTLHRAGATRWSSHLSSIRSLIDLYRPSCEIVEDLWLNGDSNPIRAEAKGAYDAMTSFEFVFILHLLREIMGITDILCQALQHKSQDILNAMQLVSTTQELLKKFRESGWSSFFQNVQSFCEKHEIQIPDMNDNYKVGTRGASQQRNSVTILHHYEVEIFNLAIDFKMMELSRRFSERTMELLVLSTALDPRDSYKSFSIDNICKLAEKFYPQDFSVDDIYRLRSQLQHYELIISKDPDFHNLSRISEVCSKLAETRKRDHIFLVDKLIRLVLTLPVSTA